jgi:hypothetical protein
VTGKPGEAVKPTDATSHTEAPADGAPKFSTIITPIKTDEEKAKDAEAAEKAEADAANAPMPTHYKIMHDQVGGWTQGQIVPAEDFGDPKGLARLIRLGSIIPADDPEAKAK